MLKISKFRGQGPPCPPPPSDAHARIHDASEQRYAAEQIAADRLPVFQRNHADRICGRVTGYSINSFVTAGLWPRSGHRGGRFSETKGNVFVQH